MLDRVPRLLSVSIRNGFIAGALGFIFLLALYYMGKHPFLFPIYFDFRIILFVVFMVMGLKELRDLQEGELSFGQGMVSNLIFTIIFALIAATGIWIFCMAVPQFLQDYIKTAMTQMETIAPNVIEQLGKEAYERNLNGLPATNASDLALDYFVKSFIVSFFLSIIISVILRQQPKTN
jgi:Protein of unknown function (DUF4199)